MYRILWSHESLVTCHFSVCFHPSCVAFPPPQARQYVESLPHFQKRDFKTFFVGANPLAIDMLTLLLEMDPDRRPSSEQLLQHPYFAKYHFPNDEVHCTVDARVHVL